MLRAANGKFEPNLLIRQYAAKVFFLNVGVRKSRFCAHPWLSRLLKADH